MDLIELYDQSKCFTNGPWSYIRMEGWHRRLKKDYTSIPTPAVVHICVQIVMGNKRKAGKWIWWNCMTKASVSLMDPAPTPGWRDGTGDWRRWLPIHINTVLTVRPPPSRQISLQFWLWGLQHVQGHMTQTVYKLQYWQIHLGKCRYNYYLFQFLKLNVSL